MLGPTFTVICMFGHVDINLSYCKFFTKCLQSIFDCRISGTRAKVKLLKPLSLNSFGTLVCVV